MPGLQTIYAASTPEGAYGELLGPLKRPARQVAASTLFDDAGDSTMEALIAKDWADAGFRLPPYVVDIDYLYASHLYTLTLPRDGWLVDAEHSRTVTYLHEHLPARVTVSHIRSEDRFTTTHFAEILARAKLATGATPIGLRFGSKHGSDWDCWAIWLRGNVIDQLSADGGRVIHHPVRNPALTAVLETFNLTVA